MGGKKYPKAENYGRAHELPRAKEWIVTRAESKGLIPQTDKPQSAVMKDEAALQKEKKNAESQINI